MFDIIPPALTMLSVLVALSCLWSLSRGVIPFSAAARRRKQDKAVLAAARTFMLSYEDLPDYSGETLGAERLRTLREAWRAKDVATCKETLELLDPPKTCAAGREWLDILVVSVSVAMAFRAYFYEPFHIPTGSMQPTLYGNHSVTCAEAGEPSFWYTTPGLRWYTWLATGRMYENFTAPFSGTLVFGQTNTGHYDMRVQSASAVSRQMLVPTDVLHPTETGDGPYRQTTLTLPGGLTHGSPVLKGQSLWRGYVCSGDFLFVNRWLWNFRHPRRGDVMIFSTTGIPKLQQGTHYIKRMTGVPNESVSIHDGHLFVNGAQPMEPLRIAQIQNHEKWHEKAYPYAGYRVSGRADFVIPGRTLAAEGDVVKLGPAEYYACGDNSPSSYDSRYWGPVPAANLCGIAGGVFWPFASHRWGAIR